MSFPVRSTSPCVRKALHERTPSHSNERSPTRSLRIVPDEELDMYTATPFPTKPEQILLPLPGKGQQQYISDTGFSYSDHQGPSTSAYPSPACSEPAANSPRDHSMGSWDVSSTVDTGNSPPPMWDDDPSSSKSSLPDDSGKARDHGAESSEVEFSDDEMMVLPTTTPTIKTVLSEPSMSSKSPAESVTDYSSPILEQIGVPSSPNFVMLDNSSTIFHRPATASSESDPRTNSLSSYNSRGTVVRHVGAAPWFQNTFLPASSEQSSYGSPSFHSSPPAQSIASFHSSPPAQSIASFRSSSGAPLGIRSQSATSSSRSLRSASDLQAAIDNDVPIQYPRIRAPSSSSSRASTSVPSERDFAPGPASGRCNPHLASGRWNPHLSTVSSIWSAEELINLARESETDAACVMEEPTSPPPAALATEMARSSVWLVDPSNDSDDERLDSLTKLPTRPVFSQSLSSGSKRSNSIRSLQRPGTGSSTILNILPTWAKVYYLREPMGLNSTLSMIDVPGPLNIPRPRSPERPRPTFPPGNPIPQRRLESDPRDPRAHWVPSPPLDDGEFTGSHLHRLRHSWSPHLMPDRRALQHSTSRWRPPSLDSRYEPVLGRRNIQVYSFCLGFIFPPAWWVAAFLPLPPKPKVAQMAEFEIGSDVGNAFEAQCLNLQQRRRDNARWWRNLNRWMIPLGVVILVVLIVLAVIGTTTGF
ncbi:Serine-rich protein, putative [Penicillium digitatum]|uniref:Serine-rich protein, putative n=1 Tax=Penicillium digitatum TaxID=36651 RepID=A0A7T6XQT1_PENDI|nr:Serine-rich protein, putative [Penicillium digitatum]